MDHDAHMHLSRNAPDYHAARQRAWEAKLARAEASARTRARLGWGLVVVLSACVLHYAWPGVRALHTLLT